MVIGVDESSTPESPVTNCISNRCITCHAGILNCDGTFGSYLTGQTLKFGVNLTSEHVF